MVIGSSALVSAFLPFCANPALIVLYP